MALLFPPLVRWGGRRNGRVDKSEERRRREVKWRRKDNAADDTCVPCRVWHGTNYSLNVHYTYTPERVMRERSREDNFRRQTWMGKIVLDHTHHFCLLSHYYLCHDTCCSCHNHEHYMLRIWSKLVISILFHEGLNAVEFVIILMACVMDWSYLSSRALSLIIPLRRRWWRWSYLKVEPTSSSHSSFIHLS